MLQYKYLAVRVKGMDHWLWFEKKKARFDGVRFRGEDGWGKRGVAIILLEVPESDVVGRLYANQLQYN